MAGLKMKFNHLSKLKKLVGDINNQKFQMGYWKEQGYHETKGEYESDPIYYTDLMYILHNGSQVRNIPARPVIFNTLFFYNTPEKDLEFKNILRKYLSISNLKSSRITAKKFLDNAAGHYVKVTRQYYGDSSVLKSNHPLTISQKGKDSPLLWSADLRDNLSYKTTFNGTLVTP